MLLKLMLFLSLIVSFSAFGQSCKESIHSVIQRSTWTSRAYNEIYREALLADNTELITSLLRDKRIPLEAERLEIIYSSGQRSDVTSLIRSVVDYIKARKDLSPAEKALLWSVFRDDLQIPTGGRFKSLFLSGTDGSYAFLGENWHILVFRLDGRMFKGTARMQNIETAEWVADYSNIGEIPIPQ